MLVGVLGTLALTIFMLLIIGVVDSKLENPINFPIYKLLFIFVLIVFSSTLLLSLKFKREKKNLKRIDLKDECFIKEKNELLSILEPALSDLEETKLMLDEGGNILKIKEYENLYNKMMVSISKINSIQSDYAFIVETKNNFVEKLSFFASRIKNPWDSSDTSPYEIRINLEYAESFVNTLKKSSF